VLHSIRVALIGAPGERERLRAQLAPGAFHIVGEFSTVSAARSSDLRADALLLAADAAQSGPRAEPLTPREIEVLELLVEGLSNKRIAAQLGISDQTVKFHVAAVCGKLGAANRTDAVRRAIRRGLVAV
jgi:two-component system, NarL family, nitrate/nitrite response regulator NarL